MWVSESELTGIGGDIWTEIARRMGLNRGRPGYLGQPGALGALAKKVDSEAVYMWATAARYQKVNFTIPHSYESDAIQQPKETNYGSPADMAGKTLATVTGMAQAPEYEAWRQGQVFQAPAALAIMDVVNGGSDAAVVGAIGFRFKNTMGRMRSPGGPADPRRLVRIGGTDAALGGADLIPATRGFLEAIQQPVIGQHDVRALRQPEVAQAHPGRLKLRHLFQQSGRMDHRARTDDVDRGRAKDAGWHQVQAERAAVVDHGVTCIVAALEADHHIGTLGHEINDAALALIAPLGPKIAVTVIGFASRIEKQKPYPET